MGGAKDYIFGAFRPTTGEAFTRPYAGRGAADWVDFLEQVERWPPAAGVGRFNQRRPPQRGQCRRCPAIASSRPGLLALARGLPHGAVTVDTPVS